MPIILFVENEGTENESVATDLSGLGHEVVSVSKSEDVTFYLMWNDHPDIVVMSENVILEGDVGSLVETVRFITEVPIIVIGEGGEYSAIQALVDGANDYVIRPVRMEELRARIIAKIRRDKAYF